MTILGLVQGAVKVIKAIRVADGELRRTFPLVWVVIEHFAGSWVTIYLFGKGAEAATQYIKDEWMVWGIHKVDDGILGFIVACLAVKIIIEVSRTVKRVYLGQETLWVFVSL